MTKKRMPLIAVLPLTVAGIVGVLAMLPPSPGVTPGVTKANFDRIEKRMTFQEVEQIFGRAGQHTWCGYWWWQADDGARALVAFDFNGDSAGPKTWEDSRESTLDKIRRWLHLILPA
jgi:hypothetical protein